MNAAQVNPFCTNCEEERQKRNCDLEHLKKQYIEELQRTQEQLNKQYSEERQKIENRPFSSCKRSCLQMLQNGNGQEAKECDVCPKLQEKLYRKDKEIEKMKEDNNKARADLEKKHQVFRERMSIEASTEIGTSGEMFEDINNPCRESELEASYKKLRNTFQWSKFIKEMEKKLKANGEERVKEEKKKVKEMIKHMFTTAESDMVKKKQDLESFFKASSKSVNIKQMKCFEMAVQSLQFMIFWEDCSHDQDMQMQTGDTSPDSPNTFFDQCYKLGCLMALHNPPLIPDWENSDDRCPIPPRLHCLHDNEQTIC